MSEPENIFENATIKFDGRRRGGADDTPIELFLVETGKGRFWFEAYYKFAENGNDFWVRVENFGLWDKFAAGSTSSLVRKAFSASEARAAKASLEALFLGPRDNEALPYLFRSPKGSRCLGVNFPDGWITAK